jgi:hypothetical protein
MNIVKYWEFIALTNCYRIQIKITKWDINLFIAPQTPKMKKMKWDYIIDNNTKNKINCQ